MTTKLDKYEEDIERNFEKQESVRSASQLEHFKLSAAKHLKNKKAVTLRVSVHDLEAIKIKASKMGLAYQTYINMLIHQAATKI